MNRKVSYEDCIRFIEHNLHLKLFDFQKEIIKCFCEGREVRTARAVGRSMCADAFGKYIAHLYDRNNYNVEPDFIVPYQAAVKVGLWDERYIEEMRMYMTKELFKLEFCSD